MDASELINLLRARALPPTVAAKLDFFLLQIYKIVCYAFVDSLLWLVEENYIAISSGIISTLGNETCSTFTSVCSFPNILLSQSCKGHHFKT